MNADPDLLTDTSTNIVDIQTGYYSDNRKIVLEQENIMVYLEEQNTILLNENFDVEVFEIGVDEVPETHTSGNPTDSLKRKTFVKDNRSLKGAEITKEYFNKTQNYKEATYDKTQSEYFFRLSTDQTVNQAIACKGIDLFNKDSYYVDLDFECMNNGTEQIYYDIYGPVTSQKYARKFY